MNKKSEETPAQARVRIHNEAVAKSQSAAYGTRERHKKYQETLLVTSKTRTRKQ